MKMTTIRQFLVKKVFENDFIFVDRWLFVHFIGFFLAGIYFPNRWGLIIGITIAIEVFERVMSGRINFFRETTKDTLSDIGINFLAYFLGQQYLASL